jgi:indolepyruvate ferredoxin oxidoreductase
MAYKDEYEVARLYTNGSFMDNLRQQFEGDFELEFYMAPPALRKPKNGAPPQKARFGSWLMPMLKVLAVARRVRGTMFDVFGRTDERRLERKLIADYEQRVRELLPLLDAQRRGVAIEIAKIPHSIRGFGHVKLANLAVARAREAELLHRLDSEKYPRPIAAPVAGQFKGIAVTSA